MLVPEQRVGVGPAFQQANMTAMARLAWPSGARRAATVAPMAKKLPCATAVRMRPASSIS